VFDNNYKNDETGSKAISPASLIKLIIYGYSKGMKSSRKISELDERGELDKEAKENYKKRQKKLNRQICVISDFLAVMKQKEGKRTGEIKSNVTDNESALIRSSSGYIQGYIGLAVSDKRNQIIVSAEAVGSANEGEHLAQMLDDTMSNMAEVGVKLPEVKKPIILGDANYFSEDNLKVCYEQNIEAIIPDDQYRKRLGSNCEKQDKKSISQTISNIMKKRIIMNVPMERGLSIKG
jgi:hypothetical protein